MLLKSGEEIDDKVNSLKRSCEIESKSIWVFNDVAALHGRISKIEKFWLDSAMQHFKDEIDRVKKIRTKALKEVGTPELLVRYDLKIGWLYETKGEKENAATHYKRAY